MPSSFTQKVEFWYPFIMFGLGLCHQVITQWAIFYYAPPPGGQVFLLVGQIGAAMVIGRIVDALSDPLIAYYSDRARSSLGRRKPFIIIGAPFFLLSFVLLWMPPVQVLSSLNFLWALTFLAIFFFSYSLIAVPYLALLPELARGEKERVKLSAYQGIAYGVGGGLGFLASTFLAPVMGMFRVSLYLTPLVALTILWPAFKVENKTEGLSQIPSPGWISQWRSVGEDRVLMMWMGIQGLCRAAVIMLVMLLPYLATVIFRISTFEDVSLAALVIIIAGSIGSGIFFYRFLLREGVDKAYQNSLFISGIALAMLSVTGFIPWNPQVQGAILISLVVGPIAIIMLLPNAVIAGMAERRQLLKGDRQEGLLYAAQGLVIKLSIAGASALLSLCLHFGGATFQAPAGIYLSSLLAGIMLIFAFFLFLRYLALKKTSSAN